MDERRSWVKCFPQLWWDSLGISRVHHAQDELDDGTVELKTSTQQVLIQETGVRAGLGPH